MHAGTDYPVATLFMTIDSFVVRDLPLLACDVKNHERCGIEIYLLQISSFKVAYYSLWGSPDAFNNMITGVHCEGANNKCKAKIIIQDNGCLLFYHALA